MQAIILAAGIGARMRLLTANTPKPLLKFKGENLLENKLHNLPDEIDEVIIVVGYLGAQIRAFFGNEFAGKKIIYVEQNEPNGTARAVALCQPFLKGDFLVLMGDDLYAKEDIKKLIDSRPAILVWELREDIPNKKTGAVKIDSEGRLREITEGQPGHKGMLVNTGAYALDLSFFKYPQLPKEANSTEFGLPQTLIQLVQNGKEIKILKATWWKNITEPADLEE